MIGKSSTLVLIALLGTGCSKLLGISDPGGGDDGPRDAGPDAEIDSSIDAPPPCTVGTAFSAEMSFDVGAVGTSLAIGELDGVTIGEGMGRDVAVAVGDGVQIMRGNGNGGFAVGMKAPVTANSVLVGFYDGDFDDDLIVWQVDASSISAMRQDSVPEPSAYLAPQPLSGTFGTVKTAVLGTIDADGYDDVLVYDTVAPTRAYTSNLGTPGTFSAGQVVPGVSGTDVLVALRNIDGESRLDAVFFTNGTVKVAFNNAGFGNAGMIGSAAGGTNLGFGNFTGGDTLLDLVIGSPQGGHLFKQTAPGVFEAVPGTIPEVGGTAMQVLDVNGDGTDDIVVDNRIVLQCPNTPAGQVGRFTQVEGFNALPPSVMTGQFTDINKNTKPDLLRLEGTTLKVRVQ